ncbi:MAG: PgaD family protein [Synechococcaceae cyanobacterium ELA739]
MPSVPPILDLRSSQRSPAYRAAQLLTLALWGGSLTLLAAPLGRVLPRLALAGAVGLPLVAVGGRRDAQLRLPPPADPERHTIAKAFGLEEAELFRARHGQCCTVHHDGEGRITALQLPEPPPARLQPDRDAHPVG